MHPADINAALRKAGWTQSEVARHFANRRGRQLTPCAVQQVIKGRSASARIALLISEITGLPVAAMWPGTYPRLEHTQSSRLLVPPEERARRGFAFFDSLMTAQEGRMTPHSLLTAELHLVLANAQASAEHMRQVNELDPVPPGVLEDHRTEVLGEIFSAIDRVSPGLGEALQVATYPLQPNEESPS